MLRTLTRAASSIRTIPTTAATTSAMNPFSVLALGMWTNLRNNVLCLILISYHMTSFRWIPTSQQQLASSEHAVLSYVTSPFRSYMVKIDGSVVSSKEKDLLINTVHLQKQQQAPHHDTATTSSHIASSHIDNTNPQSQYVTLSPRSSTSTITSSPTSSSSTPTSTSPIVLLHGYGAGVGMWFMNYDDLANDYDDVYAIDLLGCGRSSRPSFHPKTVTETEGFFVESLEAWRRASGIPRMTLTGHSFGGYMASAYALRYPEHVDRLVLVSPMGVPPVAMFDDRRYNNLSVGGRTMFQLFNALWWLDVTPQSIVRFLGPYGSGPVTNYVQKRFMDNMPDKATVAEYCYHLCAAPGSGEYALTRLISSRIQAYDPLNTRLHQLANANQHIPVSFIYGTSDWMFSSEVPSVVSELRSRAHTSQAAQLITIHDSGHQLMLDNPLGFRDAMRVATGRGGITERLMVS